MDALSKLAENWPMVLMIAGAGVLTGSILLVFAFREFLNWYLRTNQILAEVEDLRLAIKSLQGAVLASSTSVRQPLPPPLVPSSSEPLPSEFIPEVTPSFSLTAKPLSRAKSSAKDKVLSQKTFALSKETIE